MFDKYRFVLASQSPRRKELLAGLGIKFTVEPIKDEKEVYGDELPREAVPEFLARHKSESFHRELEDDEVLITADTLVYLGDELLGKPKDRGEACAMLRRLSGHTHTVLTGVVLRTRDACASFTDTTEVIFRELSDAEIEYYVDNYRPYDKAGAYGVQEWIGYAGITGIRGSYFNVMGLPVQRLYDELLAFLGSAEAFAPVE